MKGEKKLIETQQPITTNSAASGKMLEATKPKPKKKPTSINFLFAWNKSPMCGSECFVHCKMESAKKKVSRRKRKK